MATGWFFTRYRLLSHTNRLLGHAACLDESLEILRRNAREIADADGVALIRRDGDMVTYVGEDAIAPLWTGQSFPIAYCISGKAMLANSPILIPDIARDDRVPLSAYLLTFVRSMAVFPLGSPTPIAALGLYWREEKPVHREVFTLMQFLAQGANAAFEGYSIRTERDAPAVPRRAA